MTDIFFSCKPEDIGFVKLPTKREEDAGYDIYAYFKDSYIEIKPNETKLIPTGIYSACSSDYFFRLVERGSTGTRGMGQRCGVIDSGYRGEWFVPVTNHSNQPIVILRDTRLTPTFKECVIYPYDKAICQALVLPVPKTRIQYVEFEELMSMKSERGAGALGSSEK